MRSQRRESPVRSFVLGWLVFWSPAIVLIASVYASQPWLKLALILAGLLIIGWFAIGQAVFMGMMISRCRRPVARRMWILGGGESPPAPDGPAPWVG